MLLFILAIPLFLGLQNERHSSIQAMRNFYRTVPFLLIFAVSNFFLIPKFLLQDRFKLFIVISLLIIIAITGLEFYLRQEFYEYLSPPRRGMRHRGVHFQEMLKNQLLVDSLGTFIISILVIGFNAAIKVSIAWFNEQRRTKEVEKEQTAMELAMLKNQISPHFFMNTLHNIHALVDIDKASAQQSIITLSRLMRHLLYDTEKERSPLVKEIEFIESYIELMKIRYSDNVRISFNTQIENLNISIPPLLFISFIENAFKHGVSLNAPSFIEFGMEVKEKELIFTSKNSKHSKEKQNIDPAHSGIGLKNIEKRLQLLYKTSYQLTISDSGQIFEIYLKIPL